MAEDLLQDDPLQGAPFLQSDGASALDAAILRLERAISALESKLSARAASDADREGDLFESDRDRLAAELAAARTRERALQEVAAEASAALGRAAAEVRAALSAEEG